MRRIDEILKDAEVVNASIEDAKVAIACYEKRLAELHREAHRAVGVAFKVAPKASKEVKPKARKANGAAPDMATGYGDPLGNL
jgi:hypothetical protein